MAGAQPVESKREWSWLSSSGDILGEQFRTTHELRKSIEEGFRPRVLTQLRGAMASSLQDVAYLVQIRSRTLSRRLREHARLSPTESERVYRIASVLALAARLFENDREATLTWLRTPNRALGNEKPLEVARTEVGAQEVVDLIGRLEHGVVT